VGEIDGDANLVHDAYGIPAENGEARLLALEAAVAETVPEIVG
jgi:hypothetical protein